jgi:hypothetical protein
MQKLKFIFLLLLITALCFITAPKSRGGDNTQYAMQLTEVSASTGEIIGTTDLSLQTEAQLKADAASTSSSSITVLIGTGSTDPGDPVTDIQIVGIGGVAYGNLNICRPPEEE